MIRHGARPLPRACLVIAALTLACTRPDDGQAVAGGDTVTARSVDPAPLRQAADAAEPSSSYGCADEYRFVATIEDDGQSVRLLLPDTTLVLPHVGSASGARFSEGGYTYWSKGEEALLETPGRSFSGCISDEGGSGWQEAKARGVRFRAIGQEPGWIVDIHEADSITILADYGETRHRFPFVHPEVDRETGRTVYRTGAAGHRATVAIENEACRDAMSGWPYETTVRMTLDGREHRGCGRWL